MTRRVGVQESLSMVLTLALACAVGLAPQAWAQDNKPQDNKPVIIYQAPKKGQQKAPEVVLTAAAKAIMAGQQAMQKEQWEEAIAHLKTAQAATDKTAQDDYQLNELMGYAYLKHGDYAAGGAAFEAALNSGLMEPEKAAERVRILAQLYFQTKNYPKAIEYATRWRDAESGAADSEVHVLLGQSHYLNDDYRNAVTSMQAAIDLATKKGESVPENWLQVLLSSYVKLQEQPGIAATLGMLAVKYPNKRYWEDLLNVMQRQHKADERTRLNVFRLMFETGLLKQSDDYFQMSQLASRMGLPGEAVKVLEQGSAKKVFAGELDPERARQMLQEAKVAAAADRKTLVALEKEARAAKTGEADVQLGIAFISYEQYEKGVEALRRGMDKGKLKRPDEAEIMLGKALLKLNRTADAQAAFERVSDGAKLGVIADLWRIYSERPAWLSS